MSVTAISLHAGFCVDTHRSLQTFAPRGQLNRGELMPYTRAVEWTRAMAASERGLA
jgi:hypothetical protein